jgi:hypothetical protein
MAKDRSTGCGISASPPAEVTGASYRDWLTDIGSNISAFFDPVFTWYYEQLGQPLPDEVSNDRDRLVIDVRQALDETIELERAGRIESGNSFGFEAYGLMNVPIAVALEATLFYCGKPIGKPRGETYPFDTVFSRCRCTIGDRWGDGNYVSHSSQTGGGFFVSDLHDDHTILVRGSAAEGYTVFMSFFGPTPGLRTATRAQLSVVMLNSSSDGGTQLRHAVRRNGQTYGFGEFGRNEYGFNARRIRDAEQLVLRSMMELKNTHNIRGNNP